MAHAARAALCLQKRHGASRSRSTSAALASTSQGALCRAKWLALALLRALVALRPPRRDVLPRCANRSCVARSELPRGA
eukprot:3439737-Pyramimonas_sp.AAC.1